MTFHLPINGDTWVGIGESILPINEALHWVNQPDCGAVVFFSGNARNHADGRADVTELIYESYEEEALPRLEKIAEKMRKRWPAVRRLVMLHRIGKLQIGDSAVIVLVSSPHREEAFSAGRWCIDALKLTVPIWKTETWADGKDWGTNAKDILELEELEPLFGKAEE